jgi:hypothetical protein
MALRSCERVLYISSKARLQAKQQKLVFLSGSPGFRSLDIDMRGKSANGMKANCSLHPRPKGFSMKLNRRFSLLIASLVFRLKIDYHSLYWHESVVF